MNSQSQVSTLVNVLPKENRVLTEAVLNRLKNLFATHAIRITEATHWSLYNSGSGLLVIDQRAVDNRLSKVPDHLQEVIKKKAALHTGFGMDEIVGAIVHHWNGNNWHEKLFRLNRTAEGKLALVRLEND